MPSTGGKEELGREYEGLGTSYLREFTHKLIHPFLQHFTYITHKSTDEQELETSQTGQGPKAAVLRGDLLTPGTRGKLCFLFLVIS